MLSNLHVVCLLLYLTHIFAYFHLQTVYFKSFKIDKIYLKLKLHKIYKQKSKDTKSQGWQGLNFINF